MAHKPGLVRKAPGLLLAVSFVTVAAISFGHVSRASVAAAQAPAQVPIYEVDSSWPKLPNNWKLGVTSAVATDRRNHVWIMHRPRTLPTNEQGAPPILEFDEKGAFVKGWGGPSSKYEWPDSEHGIYVDGTNGVWIGGSSRLAAGVCGIGGPCTRLDSMILKFTIDGNFMMQIGHRDPPEEHTDPTTLAEVATGFSDTKNVHTATGTYVHNHELYISDGYQGPGPQGNCRVIVFDAATGAFKRMWGGFGTAPACDPADSERAVPAPAGGAASGAPAGGGRTAQPALDTEGLGSPHLGLTHCIGVSNDGLVYVCDRAHRRIQVFTVAGKYVTQVFINRSGPSSNTAASVDFSRDPEQKFMYVADYGNSHVVVMDRKTLKILYQFGERGAQPGNFQGLHNIALDWKGNLYTAEVEPGRRAQRFVYKGLGAPPSVAPAN